MKITLFLVLSLFVGTAFAQNCQNTGFEDGSFNGWVLSNGTITDDNSKPIYSSEVSGTINNEHIITTGGADPKITVENISQVAPGSKFSVRLGYTVQGGRYDRMKKTMVIGSDNTLFQFRFAIVLQQDATHADYQKPGFSVRVLGQDASPLSCSTYDVQLQRSTVANGFKTQQSAVDGELQYRNWTTAAIDLREYIGQTITIEVEVHGCTRRRHFGYAYFDAQCLRAEIVPLSNCPDKDGYITLKAPDGFEGYTWNDGSKGQTVRVKANLGSKFFVKLLPFSSLNNACDLRLDYELKSYVATNIIDKTICEGESFEVGAVAYKKSGTYAQTFKNGICDSIVTLNLKVSPLLRFTQTKTICEGDSIVVGNIVYRTDGVFTTSIPRFSTDINPACDSIVTTTLIIEKLFVVDLPKSYEIRKDDSVQLLANVSPTGIYTYQWTPPIGLSCTSCPNPIAIPTHTKTYTLKVSNEKSRCPIIKMTRVNVLNSWILLPDVFTPNNDRSNDVFYAIGEVSVKKIIEFSVFNRWGMLIFYDTNFQPSDPAHGWDGSYQGTPATTDSYAYKIKFELDTGEVRDIFGSVVLVR